MPRSVSGIWNLEDQAELSRYLVADIAQDLEFEAVLLLRRERLVRRLRRNRNQRCTRILDFGKSVLQRAQV